MLVHAGSTNVEGIGGVPAYASVAKIQHQIHRGGHARARASLLQMNKTQDKTQEIDQCADIETQRQSPSPSF